jgi:hypothetical protein
MLRRVAGCRGRGLVDAIRGEQPRAAPAQLRATRPLWPTGVPGSPEGKPREEGCYFLLTEQGWVHLPADELKGPLVAVGKLLLDHLPWSD